MPDWNFQDFFQGRLSERTRLSVSGVSLFVLLNQTLRFWLSYDIFIGITKVNSQKKNYYSCLL